jgi:hypothetical protein
VGGWGGVGWVGGWVGWGGGGGGDLEGELGLLRPTAERVRRLEIKTTVLVFVVLGTAACAVTHHVKGDVGIIWH